MTNRIQSHELLSLIPESRVATGGMPNAIAYWRKRCPGKPGRCLSQAELARLVGTSVGSIGRFERGERKPRLETLFLLSAALRVPPQVLYPELWREQGRVAQDRRGSLGLLHTTEEGEPSP